VKNSPACSLWRNMRGASQRKVLSAPGSTGRELTEDGSHKNARAANHRLAAADAGIEFDLVVVQHTVSIRLLKSLLQQHNTINRK